MKEEELDLIADKVFERVKELLRVEEIADRVADLLEPDPDKERQRRQLEWLTREYANSQRWVRKSHVDISSLISYLDQHNGFSPAKFAQTRREFIEHFVSSPDGEGLGIKLDRSRADKRNMEPIMVDCPSRLELCRAACCALPVILSTEDVKEGTLDWDIENPYILRRRDGYCVHLDQERLQCRAFHDRPAVCRSYSCKDDPRIWKDFEELQISDHLATWLATDASEQGAEVTTPADQGDGKQFRP